MDRTVINLVGKGSREYLTNILVSNKDAKKTIDIIKNFQEIVNNEDQLSYNLHSLIAYLMTQDIRFETEKNFRQIYF